MRITCNMSVNKFWISTKLLVAVMFHSGVLRPWLLPFVNEIRFDLSKILYSISAPQAI